MLCLLSFSLFLKAYPPPRPWWFVVGCDCAAANPCAVHCKPNTAPPLKKKGRKSVDNVPELASPIA